MNQLDTLPRANPIAITSAKFKQQPEDFEVTEQLSFEPSGEGEHLLLWVEKRGANTQWVAKQLARVFNVKERDVGYAGLKDRHAVTRQWFGIHLPGKPDPESLYQDEEFKVLSFTRNNKKLRHGAIAYNRFKLILNDVKGESDHIETNLSQIKTQGFPNYFGEQRFGRVENNVERAVAMLRGERRVKRHQKSIYLSALRSWFFNRYLADRIHANTWNFPQAGDKFNLNGSRSFFDYQEGDGEIALRLEQGDIHIAGPMPGKDWHELMADSQQLKYLEKLWQPYAETIELIPADTDWRPLRVIPQELQWSWLTDAQLKLDFCLPSGCYATGLLYELGDCEDASVLEERP